jgi:hypothetical protein
MKAILILCGVTVVAVVALLAYRLKQSQHFGAQFAGAPATPIAEVTKGSEGHLGHDIRVEGVITRQCPSSGCWFFLAGDGGSALRVDLGHLGLTLPQKKGHVATVEGRLVQTDDGVELIGNGVTFR